MLVTVMAQSSRATARTSRANSVRFEVLHLLGRRLAKSLEDLGRPRAGHGHGPELCAAARTPKASSVRLEVLHLLGRRLAQSLEDGGGRLRVGHGHGPECLGNSAHDEGQQRAV